MRRTIFWVLITAFTFTVGVSAAFIWFAKKTNETAATKLTTAPETISQTEMAQLSVCDLANNPEKYNGRTVRVKAKLFFFIHGFSFIDPNCADEKKQIGVIFNEKHSLQIEDKLNKEAKPNDYGYGMPIIVATGKFDQVTPSRKSDSLIDNVYLRFEIYEIEKVILNDINQ
jgi:hypothetical protein